MNDILQRIYAGFLGMNIGIRLGAPVEPSPWNYYRIAEIYGDIRDYVRPYRNFSADDDVNGPVYFLRSLLDNGLTNPLTPQAVAEAWLNYTRTGIGMFWWGGDGISCEHTAYANLRRGIPAPQSGSAEQNGVVLSEQIGGQIFIDTWGLICPGNPKKAAELAAAAASVSHDGNGIYGGAFFAACIAAAFTAASMDEVLDAGMAVIPQDCTYAQLVRAVREFHRSAPEDWHLCMEYLIANWGYDKFKGSCHIIPNAGVCILSLLYGGNFARTVEIATMCGWDTDCNAGNVGTVAGVFYGLSDIPKHYRAPMNDFIVLSGVSGYLNNLDVPSYAKFLYQLSRVYAGEAPDPEVPLPKGGELYFPFDLPGSTHGLRISNRIRFSFRDSPSGTRLMMDWLAAGDQGDIFYKPFYRRADFDDERYKPVFSPTVYSGQTLRCSFTPRFVLPGEVFARPYCRTSLRGERQDGQEVLLQDGVPVELTFRLPDTGGDVLEEIGFHLEFRPSQKCRCFGYLEMGPFRVTGKGNYRISTGLCVQEYLQQIPFAHNNGQWSQEMGCLVCRTDEPAQSFTGSYYTADAELRSDVEAQPGSCIMARAQGTRRYLAAGFTAPGRMGFLLHRGGETQTVETDYPWEPGRTYRLELTIRGEQVSLTADGEPVLAARMDLCPYGMVGFAQECPGTGRFRDLRVREGGPYADWITSPEGVPAVPTA